MAHLSPVSMLMMVATGTYEVLLYIQRDFTLAFKLQQSQLVILIKGVSYPNILSISEEICI